MKLGILGASDIAFRRFLPALQNCDGIEYAGVASRTNEKAVPFAAQYGGAIYSSYDALLQDSGIDAVYIPLPPALHFEWGRKALEAGKHILMEKPFTATLHETDALLDLAEKKNLTVHENYMFLYHNQINDIKTRIKNGSLGEIRLIRAAFGFPKRAESDFRYNKPLGGGALLDCGGYPVRLALELLGNTARITQANLTQPAGYEVDLYGSAVLENDQGLCAQISFGIDNAYQCQLEVWGSKATLIAPRIFTPPSNFAPQLLIRDNQGEAKITLPEDDNFLRSIVKFSESIASSEAREAVREAIRTQAQLVESIKQEAAHE